MFEFIRSHTKWIMFALVVLIIPSFVFFGVQGYRQSDAGANVTVATVAGQKITQAEWDQAHQRQSQRLREQMPTIDPKLLDSPAFRRETLDQLVRERVMFAAVNKMHLNVSDERLQREILAVPQLAASSECPRRRSCRSWCKY
jgi:peptidyl-prolyl cis-trans isomerase D